MHLITSEYGMCISVSDDEEIQSKQNEMLKCRICMCNKNNSVSIQIYHACNVTYLT